MRNNMLKILTGVLFSILLSQPLHSKELISIEGKLNTKISIDYNIYRSSETKSGISDPELTLKFFKSGSIWTYTLSEAQISALRESLNKFSRWEKIATEKNVTANKELLVINPERHYYYNSYAKVRNDEKSDLRLSFSAKKENNKPVESSIVILGFSKDLLADEINSRAIRSLSESIATSNISIIKEQRLREIQNLNKNDENFQ